MLVRYARHINQMDYKQIILLTGCPGGPAIPSIPRIPGGPDGPSRPLSPLGPDGPYIKFIITKITFHEYAAIIYNI